MTAVADRKGKVQKVAMKGIRKPMTSQEITETYKADMAESKARAAFKADPKWQDYSLISLAQRAEFLEWTIQTVAKASAQGRRVDFLADMGIKLLKGIELTDNMVAALRKWKNRDVPKSVDSDSPKDQPTVTMTIKIKKFLQGQLQVDSRVLTGVVKAESAKAYLMEGYADMLKDHAWCLRCGRVLTLPASFTIGLGETCAGHAGVPYPADLNMMSGKERAAYRKVILGVLHKQKFERWIPKSQIEEIISRKEAKGGKTK